MYCLLVHVVDRLLLTHLSGLMKQVFVIVSLSLLGDGFEHYITLTERMFSYSKWYHPVYSVATRLVFSAGFR